MIPRNTNHRRSAEQVEAIVVAAVAQLGYNVSDSTNYPSGVFATSVERRQDFHTPLEPRVLFEFIPTASRVFQWDNEDGSKSEIDIMGKDGRKRLLDNSRSQEIAEIVFGEAGSFEVTDLINGREYKGTAYPAEYPLSVKILREPDGGDDNGSIYRVGTATG